MKVTVDTLRSVRTILIALFIWLALMHVIAVYIERNGNHLSGFSHAFDLDNEFSAPAVYTSLLLGSSALFALILSTHKQKLSQKIIWWIFSLGFFYLAFDESLAIHEQIAAPVRSALDIGANSVFYHAWVLPVLGIGAMGLLLLAYNKRHHILSGQQTQLAIALVTLVIGDTLLESIGTKFYGSQVIYKLGPVMLEELYEIGMISLMLYLLIGFTESKIPNKKRSKIR